MRTGRVRVTVLAASVVAAAVAFRQLRIVAPVRLPQDVKFWNGDLHDIYYPGFVFAYRGEHVLPRWNPWQLAGSPFLAGYNGGFLYPPNWLATIVPVHLALGWLCAGHLAFAGVTTLVAARRLALSRPAAFVASLTFMLPTRCASGTAWRFRVGALLSGMTLAGTGVSWWCARRTRISTKTPVSAVW